MGKTTTVREFAKSRYETFVEINFLENPSATGVISGARNTNDLLLRISALSSKELVPGKTLVFFDEISVGIVNCLDKSGLHKVAFVCKGAYGGNQAYGSNRDALSV